MEAHGSCGHLRQLIGNLLALQQPQRLLAAARTCKEKTSSVLFVCNDLYTDCIHG